MALLKSQNKKLSDNGSELSKVNANLLKMVENFKQNEKTSKAALSSHQAENAKLADRVQHLEGLVTEDTYYSQQAHISKTVGETSGKQ